MKIREAGEAGAHDEEIRVERSGEMDGVDVIYLRILISIHHRLIFLGSTCT